MRDDKTGKIVCHLCGGRESRFERAGRNVRVQDSRDRIGSENRHVSRIRDSSRIVAPDIPNGLDSFPDARNVAGLCKRPSMLK